MAITCILLAAGRGSRFGSQKLLARLHSGTTVLQTTINALKPAFERVIVVVRDEAALLAAIDGMGVETVINLRADEGMGNSLACGVTQSGSDDGVVIALADMPWIKTTTFQDVRKRLAERGGIVIPHHLGRPGHPVGFDRSFLTALARSSRDIGAKLVIAESRALVNPIDVSDAGILRDVDTRADLNEAGQGQ